jgi:hypothetical protein
MAIRDTVEKGIDKFTQSIAYEKRLEFFTEQFKEFLKQYSADLLRAVLEELQGNYADMTSADDGVNVRNTGVALCIGTLTSAIGELDKN